MKPVFDSLGKRVSLDRKLGAGGEGDVFDLGDTAAKVYHSALTPQKQKKLQGMVKGCDEQLKKIAAWPIDTLHLGSGEICGFLMPKVATFEPVYKLYGPSHRKYLFPQADWAFLIHSARNIAAAFATIHSYGHVIGDVNEGGVYVGQNSIVRLIDCDSFQIETAGAFYPCDVAVLLFTPPELQNATTFSGLRRTPNHDNFGLAVLCFHLLFVGRHPFAGVYAGKEDMPIERAIKEFRFAFGKSASAKRMTPPPNSLPMSLVSPEVQGFFERAFSEDGTRPAGRPSAQDWVRTLGQMESNLRSCQSEHMHKYLGHSSACPWCALEGRSGILFFIAAVTASANQTSFNITVLWNQVLSFPSPGDTPVISPEHFKATPTPIPPEIQSTKTLKTIGAIGVGVFGIALITVHPILFIGAGIVALIIFFASSGEAAERQKRQIGLRDAESKWRETEYRWHVEAGPSAFNDERHKIDKLKNKYDCIDPNYAEEKQKLHARSEEIQLKKFLEKYFIDDATIPQIGPSRKSTLASFGIETAADVERSRITRIKGFGDAYANKLIQWRKEKEGRFVFDPAKGIDPADLAALNNRFRHHRAEIERELSSGPDRLKQVSERILEKRNVLKPEIALVAKAVAQARADASVFR